MLRLPIAWVLASMALVSISAEAQNPIASPRDATHATLNGAKVLIDYGRPSKRGRVIFGGLQQFGEVWRTGANAATTLVTDKPLKIGTLAVPAGTYTLFSIPGEARWQLIVSKKTGQWGTQYDESHDLGRVDMEVATLPEVVEKFEIKIDGGKLRLAWDKTAASVSIAAN